MFLHFLARETVAHMVYPKHRKFRKNPPKKKPGPGTETEE